MANLERSPVWTGFTFTPLPINLSHACLYSEPTQAWRCKCILSVPAVNNEQFASSLGLAAPQTDSYKAVHLRLQ